MELRLDDLRVEESETTQCVETLAVAFPKPTNKHQLLEVKNGFTSHETLNFTS